MHNRTLFLSLYLSCSQVLTWIPPNGSPQSTVKIGRSVPTVGVTHVDHLSFAPHYHHHGRETSAKHSQDFRIVYGSVFGVDDYLRRLIGQLATS